MCLQNITHPISVARSVMERCVHNVLAGEGALAWALEHGFSRVPYTMNEATLLEWNQFQATQTMMQNETSCETASGLGVGTREGDISAQGSHDTIGMLCLDANGLLCAGTSTSGWKFKHPGRVGN